MSNPPPLPPPPPPPGHYQAHHPDSGEAGKGSGKAAGIAATLITALGGIVVAVINKCDGIPGFTGKAKQETVVPDKRMEQLTGVWVCQLENPMMRFAYRVTLYRAGTMSGIFQGLDMYGNTVAGQTAGEWKLEGDEFVGKMNTSTMPDIIALGPFAQKIDALTSSNFVLRDPTTGLVMSYRRDG